MRVLRNLWARLRYFVQGGCLVEFRALDSDGAPKGPWHLRRISTKQADVLLVQCLTDPEVEIESITTDQ